MTKNNITVGHYASHKNTGGYQPSKSDKTKTLNPPKCGGVESFQEQRSAQPSDIELRIRKEVMVALDQIMSYEWFNLDSTITRARLIKDRLNLLWGDK